MRFLRITRGFLGLAIERRHTNSTTTMVYLYYILVTWNRYLIRLG